MSIPSTEEKRRGFSRDMLHYIEEYSWEAMIEWHNNRVLPNLPNKITSFSHEKG